MGSLSQSPGDDMYEFVNALLDEELEKQVKSLTANSVLRLPEGVHWLGNKQDFTNELFVRECYPELLDVPEAYRAAGRSFSTVLVTGTPGIGKSHLAALVISQKLLARERVLFELVEKGKGLPVFYELSLQDGRASVVLHFGRKEAVEAARGKCYYISDGGAPSISALHECSMIFASPDSTVFREDTKHNNLLTLFMPLFSCEELELCAQRVEFFRRVDVEDVRQGFALAGGIARTVLQAQAKKGREFMEEWKKAVRTFLANQEEDKLMRRRRLTGKDGCPQVLVLLT